MSTDFIDLLPLGAPFLITWLLIAVLLGIGRKLRQLHQKHYGDVESGSIGIVVASLLGLLGFLLAFTFGMAATRFDDRRHAVLTEANAIGTAYLRADILPEQQRTEAKRLLQEYVEIRSRVAASAIEPDTVTKAIEQSIELHEELWQVAVAAAKINPSPITGLFIQAVNELIDIHSDRVMLGTKSTIPIEIWICLYVVAAISLGSAGFQWTSSNSQSIFPFIALALTFAAVLTIVADLDNPARGFISTDQSPLLDLSASFEAAAVSG